MLSVLGGVVNDDVCGEGCVWVFFRRFGGVDGVRSYRVGCYCVFLRLLGMRRRWRVDVGVIYVCWVWMRGECGFLVLFVDARFD